MGSNPFLGTTSTLLTRRAREHLPRWRNWYTRTFEGRMRQLIRVQVPAWAPPRRNLTTVADAAVVMLSLGRLAQLVRAPRLHRGGHRFEPCTAHHPPPLDSTRTAGMLGR